MKIIYGPDKTIYGVQPDRDFSVSISSEGESQNLREFISGDATYKVKVYEVNLDINKGVNLDENIDILTYGAATVNQNKLTFDKFQVPSINIDDSFLGWWTTTPTPAELISFDFQISSRLTDRKLTVQYNPFFREVVNFKDQTIYERKGIPELVSVDHQSLGYHIFSNVRLMIEGRSPGINSQRLFSSISPENSGPISGSFAIRNPNCIISGYDSMFATSVWTGTSGQQLPVVLITPQHVYASHVLKGIGTEIGWVTKDNQVVIRTIVDVVQRDDQWQIAKLNAPITNIEPFTLAPNDLTDYLPSLKTKFRMTPCIAIGRNIGYGGYDGGAIGIRGLVEHGRIINGENTLDNYTHFLDKNYLPWTWNLTVGDSNNPFTLPINGKLVLLGTEFYGSGGLIPNILNGISIQDHINSLGSEGYSVNFADLSMFPKYN